MESPWTSKAGELASAKQFRIYGATPRAIGIIGGVIRLVSVPPAWKMVMGPVVPAGVVAMHSSIPPSPTHPVSLAVTTLTTKHGFVVAFVPQFITLIRRTLA